MKAILQDGFGSFEIDTTIGTPYEYIEPNKQVLVVIGGVTFFSLPVGPNEARHLLQCVKNAAPNTDPMIVVAN